MTFPELCNPHTCAYVCVHSACTVQQDCIVTHMHMLPFSQVNCLSTEFSAKKHGEQHLRSGHAHTVLSCTSLLKGNLLALSPAVIGVVEGVTASDW